ncbi:hypothetical protein [Spiroplasma poulsonii]|uniref:hypothetical protein n=1 Tax=Spiroplasma poulsonii TaxID=2138 RepID=UPI001F4CCF61|nr:hypothetical protein [Spiroplasma poulsonii]UNF61272.1 hypothetical protein MNU24_04980 [Spiroplasma poulsonii]
MLLDILKVAEIEKFKRLVKLIKLSLENDYYWLCYVDEEYQTYFHLGRVLILFGAIHYVSLSELKCIKNSDFQTALVSTNKLF